MKDTLREHLRKAGKASAAKLTKKQRIERARKAGKASGKARRKTLPAEFVPVPIVDPVSLVSQEWGK